MPRSEAPLVVGVSLKMYFGHRQTVAWAEDVARIAREHEAVTSALVDLVVLPGFLSIDAVLRAFAGTRVSVGGQDLFWIDRGAYTGEVSGADLAELGCRYVEVGHAERRRLFGETDETVADKVDAALRNSLAPFLCVGETERMPAAQAASACIAQVQSALSLAEKAGAIESIVVAYEPEWAIGAEESASAEHIREVGGLLRDWLAAHPLVATGRVIYGGSAGPGLLGRLGASVDGLFLGRFAHDPAALARVLDEALLLQRPVPVEE